MTDRTLTQVAHVWSGRLASTTACRLDAGRRWDGGMKPREVHEGRGR